MSRLKELYREDQSERVDHPLLGTPEYTALRRRDHDRREEARQIIAANDRLAGDELYCAAMLFQHADGGCAGVVERSNQKVASERTVGGHECTSCSDLLHSP